MRWFAFHLVTWSIWLILAACSGTPWSAQAQEPPSSYLFDAGAGDRVAPGVVPLRLTDSYEPSRGYGWTEAPRAAFSRPDLERSRTALTLDGVTGWQIGFRADVPPGRWWVTLWVEAGLEDSSTVAIALQGKQQAPGWTAFPPEAEPRETIQKIYRVFHHPVQVEDGALRFTLTAGADSVRLLGFSLTPNPTPTTAQEQDVRDRLAMLGRYDALSYDPEVDDGTVYETLTAATDELARLRADLNALRQSGTSEAFVTYWTEQIDLLTKAERYFARRGWEWANRETGLGLFERLHQAVMLLDGLLSHPDAAASPLFERALFTRGRLRYWLARQRGGPAELAQGRRDLAILHERHPQDPVLRMYLGERVEQPDPCDTLTYAAEAPAWSVAQREALCRLKHLAHWWVEKQQAPNGELGGKLGDDVELLRWWPPLILAGDTTTLTGWQRLADGVWNSRHIENGYARQVSDVEHASEFISDTAPQMVVFSDDPAYVDRLAHSAHHFDTLWTAHTPAGQRYFRSAWFSATEVETDPPKNRDVEYNTRAAKAVRYYAWKTGDERAATVLHEWARAWVHAARRTDKGKPQGLIPASIRFPDEAINGDEPTWYEANMYWTYFDWTHYAGSIMLEQQLFSYTLTGDSTLLEPLLAALDLVRRYEDAPERDAAEPGSAAWAAGRLREQPVFWSVAAQWRLYTGDTRYDDLLMQYGTPYIRYRLTGDEAVLVEGLQSMLDAVRYNAPLRTYEAIHTDRVYVTDGDGPGADHLQAMLTGNGIHESISPYYAAGWDGTDDAFTALVTATGPNELGIQVFSHAAEVRAVRLRVWQLTPGTYRMTRHVKDRPDESATIEITRRGQVIPLSLPPQTLLEVRITKP